MKGRYPTDDDQRSLTAAGDSVDTLLMKLIQSRYPTAAFTVFMVREWKEKYSFVGEAPESVVVTVPVTGVPTRIDITHEMRTACDSIVAPIVETMLDLLLHVEPEFQEHVRKNVILAGGGGQIRNLGPTLERALERVGGGKVKVIEGPAFVGSDGGLALAKDAQDSDWDRLLN
jgi:rod shape-determining protein MreB